MLETLETLASVFHNVLLLLLRIGVKRMNRRKKKMEEEKNKICSKFQCTEYLYGRCTISFLEALFGYTYPKLCIWCSEHNCKGCFLSAKGFCIDRKIDERLMLTKKNRKQMKG